MRHHGPKVSNDQWAESECDRLTSGSAHADLAQWLNPSSSSLHRFKPHLSMPEKWSAADEKCDVFLTNLNFIFELQVT